MDVEQDLRGELLCRADVDQAARNADDPEAVHRADAENLPWLRHVITEHGWPGRSAVGEDGAMAAWLLAQHADSDPAFQRMCLDLLTAAAEAGEATKSQVAYLTDRVLLAEGKPQEFGTQVTGHAGRWMPCNLRDPDHVDDRRAAMSLGTLAEYLAHFETDGPPAPVSMTCPHCGGLVHFWPPDPGEDTEVDCAGCDRTLRIRMVPPDATDSPYG